MAKQMFLFFPDSLPASALGAVPHIWLNILVPVVLFCSHRDSVFLHKPVLTYQNGPFPVWCEAGIL